MKKLILILLVLFVGFFFSFFEIDFGGKNKMDFVEDYKEKIGYTAYKAEQIFSTNPDNEGLKLTFTECSIDSNSMVDFKAISRAIAVELNEELNTENQFKNIILVYEPKDKNKAGINQLKYTFVASLLKAD